MVKSLLCLGKTVKSKLQLLKTYQSFNRDESDINALSV